MSTSDTAIRCASLPLQPLWDMAHAKSDMPGVTDGSPAALGFTAALFAEMVGHNVRAVSRWQETGTLPWFTADEAATRMGTHPMLVWGDDWLNVKGDYAQIAAGDFDAAIERDFARAEAEMARAALYAEADRDAADLV